MPPEKTAEKTKARVKTRIRQRMPRERETFVPIASPTLIFFLIAGAAAALGIIYMLVKFLTHMGGVSDMG